MRYIRILSILFFISIIFVLSCKGPENILNVESFYPYDNQVFTTNKVKVSFNVKEVKGDFSVSVRANDVLVYKGKLYVTNEFVVDLDKPTNVIYVEVSGRGDERIFSKEVIVFYNKLDVVREKRKVVVKAVKAKKPRYTEIVSKMERSLEESKLPKVEEVRESVYISSVDIDLKDDLGLNTFRDSIVLKYVVRINEEFKNRSVLDVISKIEVEIVDVNGDIVFSKNLIEPQATLEIKTSNLPTGSYILAVRVTDVNGRAFESSKWVSIDKSPPVVFVNSLSNGVIVREQFSFSVEAKDDSGVADLYSTIADKKLEYTKKGNAYVFSFNSRAYQNGKYTIQVYAKDKLGNEIRTNFLIFIDNWLEYVVDESLGAGFHVDSFLDEEGGIHLAYYNSTKKSLYYAYNKGDFTNWNIQVVDSRPDSGKYPSIYVDNFDRIHVAYTYINERWDDEDLRYAVYDGNSWKVMTLDEQDKAGRYTGIVVDKRGVPHISYYNYTVGSLRYITYNIKMDRWEVSVPDSYENVGSDTSIALDSKNVIHIVYLDNANGDLKHCYKGVDETDAYWKFDIVDDEGKVGYYAKMKIDKNDNIHVVYYDATKEALKYAVKKGGKWTKVIVDKDSDPGRFASIFVDENNNVHVSYFVKKTREIRYAVYDGKSWKIENVVRGRAGGWSSVLFFKGKPIIFFYDENANMLKMLTK